MRAKLTIVLFLCCLSAYSQREASAVTQSFDAWQSKFPQYRLHAFFNQTKYAPGDTAYFQSYLLTEQWKPVPGRRILTLSVFDCRNHEVAQINFQVRNGSGSNQWLLPKLLEPGYYRAVIYDNYMRNFDPSLFYYETLEVVGSGKMSASSKEISESVSFYPEGGNLIAGTANKVVVMSQSRHAMGELKTESGDFIASFMTDELGLGVVVFKPEAQRRYQVHLNGKQYTLPTSEPDKIALLLTPQKNGKPIKLIVFSSPGGNAPPGPLTLLVASQGRLFFSAELKLDGKDFVQTNIPQDNLPEGIAQLSIVNEKGVPVASRLFPVVKDAQPEVALTVTPAVTTTRGELFVDVTLKDGAGNPLQGEFAISVTNMEEAGTDSAGIVPTPLLADVASIDPALSKRSLTFEQIDRWLLTQSWRRYNWQTVMSQADEVVASFPPSNVFRKRGIAFDSSTGRPAADSSLVSVFFIKNTVGYHAYTNSKGEFEMTFLLDLWGTEDVFYTVSRKDETLTRMRIKWLDIDNPYPPPCATPAQGFDQYHAYATKKQSVNNSYSFFTKPAENIVLPPQPDAIIEDELSGADVTVVIHDYVLFPTMAETLREIVPLLKHRIVNGKSVVRAFVDLDNYHTTADPLYIIDGILTYDTELFLGLNPDDVLTIKIVSNYEKLRRLGDLGKNGLVMVHTRKTEVPGLKASSTVLPITGMSKPIAFSQPARSRSMRIPDFRSAIFWNPSVVVGPDGKSRLSFFASDDTGPISIQIRGLASNGRWFSARTTCAVEFVSSQK